MDLGIQHQKVCDKYALYYESELFPFISIFKWVIVCFVALRPKSTAMVMAGRSVHLTTLFSWVVLRAHTFACN